MWQSIVQPRPGATFSNGCTWRFIYMALLQILVITVPPEECLCRTVPKRCQFIQRLWQRHAPKSRTAAAATIMIEIMKWDLELGFQSVDYRKPLLGLLTVKSVNKKASISLSTHKIAAGLHCIPHVIHCGRSRWWAGLEHRLVAAGLQRWPWPPVTAAMTPGMHCYRRKLRTFGSEVRAEVPS